VSPSRRTNSMKNVIFPPWFHPLILLMIRPNGISKKVLAWIIWKILCKFNWRLAGEVYDKLKLIIAADERAAEIAATQDPNDEPATIVYVGQDGVMGVSKINEEAGPKK
jgi:hypothetical protein